MRPGVVYRVRPARANEDVGFSVFVKSKQPDFARLRLTECLGDFVRSRFRPDVHTTSTF